MKQSTHRILTTHTGRLPRPADLQQMLEAQDRGEPIDRDAFEARGREAVKAVVQRQATYGIDIVNDGEMSKISYSTYVKEDEASVRHQHRRISPTFLDWQSVFPWCDSDMPCQSAMVQ